MSRRKRVPVWRFIAAWSVLAVPAIEAAEHRGTVTTGGLPLPGVTVTAVQGEKKIVTTTDERGAFAFADLPDGLWTIQVEMTGFGGLSREIAVVSSAPPSAWDLRFAQDAAAAAPPRVVPQQFRQVNVHQSAENSTFASEGQIKSQEVADLSQTSANSFIVQGSMSTALGMQQQNDWSMPRPGMGPDGVMGPPGAMGGPGLNGEPPSFTNALGAQRTPGGGPGGPGGGPPPGAMGGGPGRMGGGPPGGGPGGPGGPGEFQGRGGRGGGPEWQGMRNAMAFGNNRRDPLNSYSASASFSLNNSVFDARTFSVTGATVAKPAYATGRGSIMLGGPLQIPKLVSKERRILFTLDIQMQRSRTGTVSDPVNMPTLLERSGDFSATTLAGVPVTLYDPSTGLPFPGNVIPAGRIDSAAAALLKYYPNPNLAGASQNFQTAWNGNSNSHNLNSRLSNIRIGSNDRLNFGVGYQGSNSSSPNLFGFIDSGSGRAVNTNLGWSHTITTTLVNNANVMFSRMRQQSLPYFANRENVAAGLNIAGTSQNPLNWGPPNLGFTNYAGLSDGNASVNRNQTASAGDSLAWVHGTHNFTFGADYRRMQFNQFADSNGRGTYSFNGALTGYDLADFLLGLPTTGSIRYGNPDKYLRGAGYDFFVNDDWRISTRFTLIAGIRWDYTSPMNELYNRLVNLAIAPGFTSVTAVEAGQSALINPDRNNFSPRLGFAWRPSSRNSFVVRGGYGLYYNTSVYNLVASNMAQQPPFAQSLNASTSAAAPLTITNGFLMATSLPGANTYAIDPNYRIGYAQSWNVSVQHDLPFGMFGTAGYLGTKGTRLDQQFIPNSAAPGAAESAWPHGYIYEMSNGNSIYHAAQFQLNRRFRSGIMANTSYQFSKAIDNAGTGGRGQGNTPIAQNWLDLSAERALSSFDARHNLNVMFQYSSGMGTSGGTLLNGWKGMLLKDWTFSGNINVRSGTPLTATVGGGGSQVRGTAVTNVLRADATGLPIDATGMRFNTAAFAQPLSGFWGTAARNTIPGPMLFSLNGSVSRIFRFGERRSADLQFQAQNLLNHVTITNWGTVVGATNYGLATTAASMRKITVNLRFRF
jgi:hypothetical protein